MHVPVPRLLLLPRCEPVLSGRTAPFTCAEGLLERALSRGDISEFDVAGGAHCMHPAFLQLSLNRSLGVAPWGGVLGQRAGCGATGRLAA